MNKTTSFILNLSVQVNTEQKYEIHYGYEISCSKVVKNSLKLVDKNSLKNCEKNINYFAHLIFNFVYSNLEFSMFLKKILHQMVFENVQGIIYIHPIFSKYFSHFCEKFYNF